MPFINGYDLSAEITKLLLSYKIKIPIISYSSTSLNANEETKQMGFGIDDFLEKPASMKKFREKLIKWAGHIQLNEIKP